MKNLNFIGPANPLGYGVASYNLLVNLARLYDVAYWPLGNIDYPVPPHLKSVIQDALNRQGMFDFNAPTLRVWHQHDMAMSVGSGPRIGMPIFELNKFNDVEKNHLKSLDEIFVCSNWAKEIIAEEIGITSHVVPLGVDRDIFFNNSTPAQTYPYIFLNVGKWEIRKGHDILLDAFLQAFNEKDNVELWMMNHNPFLTKEKEQEWINYYKNHKLGNKVKILPRVQTQKELADIMRQAHCGVFPARAEGWNLEALEMLSVGCEVIVTDYSAHKEFCFSNNSLLIGIRELEEAYDGIWFNGQGEWAKLDKIALDMLISHMRFAYSVGPRLNNDGIQIAKQFSWQNAALAAQKGLENVG